MNYFRDAYAQWKFRGFHEVLDFNTFVKFTLADKRELILSRIYNFKIIIDILSASKLLLPTLVYIDIQHFYIEDVKGEDYFNKICNLINTKDIKGFSISIDGKTEIVDNENKFYEEIIDIDYEPALDLITIRVKSDIFQPYSEDGEDINIQRAQINSKRLETALQEIKEKGIFKKITPDENEDEEEICLQHGFRMYYREKAIKDFFPNEDLEIFSSFIWERIPR